MKLIGHSYNYKVVTDISSKEDAETDVNGRQILFKTNNYKNARKKCIEWAAFDDIEVFVLDEFGSIKFSCQGASEAFDRFPKTFG
jgi:hypothetical protein